MDAKAISLGLLGAMAVLGLWLGLGWQGLAPWEDPPPPPPEPVRVRAERAAKFWAVGAYQVELREHYFTDNEEIVDQTLVIRQGEREVARIDGERVEVEKWLSGPTDIPFPEFAANLTGGTEPQLLVQVRSGGPDCCLKAEIVELGPQLVRIAVPGGGRHPLHLSQLDDTPALEAVVRDPTFDKGAPPVVLRFAEGGYRLAADLMRRPAPAPDDLNGRAALIKLDEGWGQARPDDPAGIPEALTSTFLELAYTGNLAAAGALVEAAWRPEQPGRDEFRRNLERCLLRSSPYWPDLAALNAVPADPPEDGCGGGAATDKNAVAPPRTEGPDKR